jgi:hypothetical protein
LSTNVLHARSAGCGGLTTAVTRGEGLVRAAGSAQSRRTRLEPRQTWGNARRPLLKGKRLEAWERYGLESWLGAARKRLHHNVLAIVLAIALANKLARIAWSVAALSARWVGA